MLLRIAGIVFPIFLIVMIGFAYGRKRQPDMGVANQLNMSIFLPALIFSALAGKSFNLADNAFIALGAVVVVLGSGLLAWPLARLLGYQTKTLLPPIMFNNVGNMGLPLLLLTFGPGALGAAVMLMLVLTLLQFTLSAWILNGRLRLDMLWQEPVFAAAALGVAVSLMQASVWAPLMTACKLLGDISLGLMIFSLGVRLSTASLNAWGVGVVGAIAPFNFPLNLPAHKVAPAIAVGAPIVVKPAPQTPLSMLELRRIAVASGWPAEAMPVLCVDNAAAEALVLDPRLPVVSFTGSVDVGWKIRSLVPRKKVALELGGNAAAIVHEDADLADAVARSVAGAFGYAGQTCISLQRALVHRPVYDRYRDALVAKAAALVSGDPSEEATDVGPMISETAARRAEAWVGEAVAAGARLLCGGVRKGSFLSPTVLEGTTREMKVECSEVFAPVVTVSPYDSFEEALARAGDSRYGLQAGVFTRDLGRVMKAWEALEVGGVIVNDVPTWRVDRMPYGGVRDSGVGREGPAYAMDEYTEPRILVLRVP